MVERVSSHSKLLILVIVGLSAVLATFAWWYRWQQGERALSLWGSETAWLIRHAGQVELLRLADPAAVSESADSEMLLVDGQRRLIQGRKVISKARGIQHARQALIEDASFHWDASRDGCPPHWDYLLRFTEGALEASVAIDLDCQRVRLVQGGREVSVAPIADGLRQFLNEQFP